jgi:hypothetical protein
MGCSQAPITVSNVIRFFGWRFSLGKRYFRGLEVGLSLDFQRDPRSALGGKVSSNPRFAGISADDGWQIRNRAARRPILESEDGSLRAWMIRHRHTASPCAAWDVFSLLSPSRPAKLAFLAATLRF